MLRRARIGAAKDEAPVGKVRRRRPDLLPVNHPRVPDALGAGLHVREVGPRVRLRVPLAPQLVPLPDRRQEPPLLRFGPEGDQRRPEELFPDVSEPPRRPSARVLLVERDLLGERRVAPAVLLRPAEAGPPRRGERPLPRPPRLGREVLVARASSPPQGGKLVDEMRLEPPPHVPAERLGVRVRCRPSRASLGLAVKSKIHLSLR